MHGHLLSWTPEVTPRSQESVPAQLYTALIHDQSFARVLAVNHKTTTNGDQYDAFHITVEQFSTVPTSPPSSVGATEAMTSALRQKQRPNVHSRPTSVDRDLPANLVQKAIRHAVETVKGCVEWWEK